MIGSAVMPGETMSAIGTVALCLLLMIASACSLTGGESRGVWPVSDACALVPDIEAIYGRQLTPPPPGHDDDQRVPNRCRWHFGEVRQIILEVYWAEDYDEVFSDYLDINAKFGVAPEHVAALGESANWWRSMQTLMVRTDRLGLVVKMSGLPGTVEYNRGVATAIAESALVQLGQ